MIRICYIPEGNEYYYLIRNTAYFLKKHGVDVLFVAWTHRALRDCRTDGFKTHFIGDVFHDKRPLSQQEVLDLDLKYGPFGIKQLCNSDLYIKSIFRDNADQELTVARAYKFWENFLEENKIDYLMSVNSDLIPNRTAYNVARLRGNPQFWKLSVFGVGDNSFVLGDVGEDFCWSELLGVLGKGIRPLNVAERSLTLDFVKERVHHTVEDSERFGNIFDNYHKRVMAPTFLSDLRQIFWMWRKKMRERRQGNIVESGITNYALRKRVEYFFYKYAIRNIFRYDDISSGERFVYTPLFYERESSRLALYHYWCKNQFSLIQETAHCLPHGFKLYVKEHPSAPGAWSLAFLKKLKAIPRVRIIHSLTSVHELMARCEAVVALEGNSSWEAYLLRKPVVSFGSRRYTSYSRLVYNVNNPCDLAIVLFRAIQKGVRLYEENENEWLWFIHSVITTCGKGNIRAGDDNYKKLGLYILDKIKRHTS